MISHERAIELGHQAERLYREIVRWHGTPCAARVATAYARTIDRLIEYKRQRLAREATTTDRT